MRLHLALDTIQSLKNLGITISLDGFGTGYSSLTQLQALPFDRIKIDRSFVMTMAENEDSAAIVSAVASLASSLRLPATAEGIETDAIRKSLKLLGCSQGQGWHFGKALPGHTVEEQFDVSTGEPAAAPPAAENGEPPSTKPNNRRQNSRRPLIGRAAA